MIRILDEQTIDLIAAGEVVERPLSVVKELVENSIDAGSGAITVEIRGGGIDFIRVTDDGEGIASGDIKTAFLRHATSKISGSEDLTHIHSLGFRGEALSSICAVARVELITRTADEIAGSRYVIEGGKDEDIKEIGAPEGTTFIIRDLFFNTPARREFLKTPATEGRAIEECMLHFTLSHPNIRWQFIAEGRTKFATAGDGSLKTSIYYSFGSELSKLLVNIDGTRSVLHLTGYIAKPEFSRGNKSYMIYFVNGRYIKSTCIQAGILDGYRDYLMGHRFPFVALNLEIPAESMDVNVHPTKLEVRFADEKAVYELVYDTIKRALDEITLIPEETLSDDVRRVADYCQSKNPVQKVHAPEPFEQKRFSLEQAQGKSKDIENQETMTESSSAKPNSSDVNLSADAPNTTTANRNITPSFTSYNAFREEDAPAFRIIGQVFKTYWMIEYKDELLIIDQHAAHEKVLYERFVVKMKAKTGMSQELLAPLVVSLSGREQSILEENLDAFTELGFRLESFGEREYLIQAVPADFLNLDAKELFIDILDTYMNEQKGKKPEMVLDHLATIACKAAVKGNNELSEREARTLIGEMLTLDEPYHCPHGRPTTISFSEYEFEKRFKRIV